MDDLPPFTFSFFECALTQYLSGLSSQDMNLQSLDVEAAEILRQELENADVQIQ